MWLCSDFQEVDEATAREGQLRSQMQSGRADFGRQFAFSLICGQAGCE